MDMISQKRKRTQSGVTTSDVVMSSHTGDNSEIFAAILSLHVKPGAKIIDVTYGTGVFWRSVDISRFDLTTTDLKTGVDCRALPYDDNTFDVVVFDPPYMEGFYRRSEDHLAGDGSHSAFRKYYSDGKASEHSSLKYHDRVVDMYLSSAREARRVLKTGGTFIVKCQDEVSANRQKLTHVEIIYGLENQCFYCKDLFVLTRSNAPVITKLLKQEHARKNHSYFLVFIKEPKSKLRYRNCSNFVRSYSDDLI